MTATHAAPATTDQQDQDPPQCILCWNGTPAELLVRLHWLLWDGGTLAERDQARQLKEELRALLPRRR